MSEVQSTRNAFKTLLQICKKAKQQKNLKNKKQEAANKFVNNKVTPTMESDHKIISSLHIYERLKIPHCLKA